MTNMNNETLGRRIARLRLQHAMTQERLANIANVSAQAVSKWENDQSYPDIMLLPLLAQTFGVTVDELLGVETPVEVTQPMPEPQPIPEPEPVLDPEPEPEPEPVSDPEPEPEPELEFRGTQDIDGTATCIRIHVIQGAKDAVNLVIPLIAARFVSNVAGYLPNRLTEGIDIANLGRSIQNAGRGTLIDADDGNSHVIITLE